MSTTGSSSLPVVTSLRLITMRRWIIISFFGLSWSKDPLGVTARGQSGFRKKGRGFRLLFWFIYGFWIPYLFKQSACQFKWRCMRHLHPKRPPVSQISHARSCKLRSKSLASDHGGDNGQDVAEEEQRRHGALPVLLTTLSCTPVRGPHARLQLKWLQFTRYLDSFIQNTKGFI